MIESVELFGTVPLTDAELQTLSQAVVDRQFPTWKRERAARLGGDALAALNLFFDEFAQVVDAARQHHADLFAAAPPAPDVVVVPDESAAPITGEG